MLILWNGKKTGDKRPNPANDTIVPNASTILEIFSKKTSEWFLLFPNKSDIYEGKRLLDMITTLHYCNFNQWIWEDIVHSKECSDNEIVRLKKEIDVSNLERYRLIEKIDEYFLTKLKIVQKDSWENLYINSQTLAEMIGKLSVQCLKLFYLGEGLKKISPESKDALLQQISTIRTQIKYVASCFDRFSHHLRQGKGYMPFGEIKVYGILDSKLGKNDD